MRPKYPSSRGTIRFRFSSFDIFWAAMSPLLALYLRDAQALSWHRPQAAILYCGISLAVSLMAFLAFHTSDGVSRYFSVHDALNIVKAVVCAALITSVVLFTLNRLEGIPRSTPVLHALILAAGLLSARTLMLLWHNKGQATERVDHSAVEHIIMIGSTRLSSLYMKFLQALDPFHRRFIAVLDHQQDLIGRAMCGVPIFASAKYLERVIEDFVVHGIRIDRVMIGGDENLLPQEELNVVLRVCAQREIPLDFVSSMVGLDQFRPPSNDFVPTSKQTQRPSVALPVYFRVRPTVDFVVALTSIIILLPLIAVASLLVLIDVGAPVLFWQQRTGKDGRSFFLYKFRTLRIPFDRNASQLEKINGSPGSDVCCARRASMNSPNCSMSRLAICL